MKRPLSILAILLLAAGCSDELPHDSPYDPEAPLAKQARAQVAGMVALEGETDFGQVSVELQNDERTYTASSHSDGAIELTGVVPGEYTVRYTARYFEESLDTVKVTLGEELDLGLRALALKKAAVEGKASAIRAAGTVGGLIVTLAKAASIRGADAAAAPAWLPTFFSAAEPPALSFTAVSGGDGTFRIEGVPAGVYDVYVGSVVVAKVTVTGEQAVVTLDPVTLDEAGPAVPNLEVGDIDGDGFALDATTVELTWTKPSEADLSHFELQRYVVGVDAGFVAYATLDKTATAYTDDVSATSGRKHLYRIRSVDEIGNASDWSLVAEAEPFEAVEQAYWVQGGDGIHYFFPVAPGTNSLSAVYFYNDANKSRFSTALANNVTEWLRPASAANWEETVMLRTANQSNSLAYESEFSLGLNRRSVVAHDNDGAYLGYGVGLAVDGGGAAHVAYSDGAFGGMWLGVQDGDGWVKTRIEESYNTYYYTEVFLHAGAHKVVYADSSVLRYATDATGGFAQTTLANVDFRGMSAAIDTAGRVHIVGALNNGGVNTTIRYLRVDGNAIAVSEDVATVAWLNQSPAVAVAPDGRVHVVYYSGTPNFDLIYATRAPAGGWAYTTLDSTGTTGQYPSLSLDQGGNLHVAYLVTNDGLGNVNKVRYLTKPAGGGWAAAEMVDTTISADRYTAVAVTPEGDRFVFFTDNSQNRLYVARRGAAGGWSTVQVETPINQYYGHSLRAAVDRRHRVHAVYMHNDERDVRHLVMSTGVRPEENTGYGWNYYADVAAGGTGEIHTVYGDRWSAILYHRTNRSGVWTTSTIDTGTQSGKIAVAPDGTVHALYPTGGSLRYGSENAGVWSNESVPGSGSPYDYAFAYGAGGGPGAVFSTNANPSRVYFTERAGTWSAPVTLAEVTGAQYSVVRLAYAGGDPVVAAGRSNPYGVTKLFRRTAGSWTALPFAPPATQAVVQDLAVDADGALHLALYDPADLDLWYATNRGGAWAFKLVDAEGDTGYQAKIILDDRGRVHIAFMNSGSDFAYATDVGGWHTVKIVDAPFGLRRISFARDAAGNLHGMYVNGDWVYALPFMGGRLEAGSVGRVSGW